MLKYTRALTFNPSLWSLHVVAAQQRKQHNGRRGHNNIIQVIVQNENPDLDQSSAYLF